MNDLARVSPIAFTVRWGKIEEQLVELATARQHVGTLAEAEARIGFGPFLLSEIAGGHVDDHPGAHFGASTKVFWSFIYELFAGGAGVVAHPAGFGAKSVFGVDVYERPVEWARTGFIGVWATTSGPGEGPPVLVPFPTVPEVLMTRDKNASFGDSCRAYRELVAETTARVNLVAPAALALARQADAGMP